MINIVVAPFIGQAVGIFERRVLNFEYIGLTIVFAYGGIYFWLGRDFGLNPLCA